MNDTSAQDFYIPSDIPPKVLAYGSEVPQLGVGSAGKLGVLILRLEYDTDSRKTIVRDLYTKVPLCAGCSLFGGISALDGLYLYYLSLWRDTSGRPV